GLAFFAGAFFAAALPGFVAISPSSLVSGQGDPAQRLDASGRAALVTPHASPSRHRTRCNARIPEGAGAGVVPVTAGRHPRALRGAGGCSLSPPLQGRRWPLREDIVETRRWLRGSWRRHDGRDARPSVREGR